MALNQVSRKRKSLRTYQNCPKPLLNVVPSNCAKLKFTDLNPSDDYEYKAIIGKIKHLYPIGPRMGGHVRKVLVTDALADNDENPKQISIFLLNQFAKESESAEVEGFIIVTNFIVEKLTSNAADVLPIQVLVHKEDSQVWFGKKIKSREKRAKTTISEEQLIDGDDTDEPPIPRKRQKTTTNGDQDGSIAVRKHNYVYTKLGDVVFTDDTTVNYNVYGIVDNCDLKITQAKSMQILYLTITDQTETGFPCTIFSKAGESFPNVYPGDIVRIHRMQVYKFRAKLQGRCPDPKYLLVFGKDNQGDKPRTVAKTFTFTPDDVNRCRELFDWYKMKSMPKLISEIQRDDFVNFVCQVIGVYIARTTDCVILKLWDGTKTHEFPGVHWGMKAEKLDQRLFTIARSYYVVLSVYGHHAAVAAELQPGQFIEVNDAHLYTSRDDPDNCKLCLHVGNPERRGITVLSDDDDKVVELKERLNKVIAETLEYGNSTQDLLSENNSIFLNCDISVFGSSQPSSSRQNGEVDNQSHPKEPIYQNGEEIDNPLHTVEPAHQNGEDVEILNEPLSRNETLIRNEPTTQTQNTVISILNASIKPGQSTQEFGLGMPRHDTTQEDETRLSAVSEPDPICNMTPLQTRFFFHDPLQLGNQASSSIYPASSNSNEDEWWNSLSTVSATDGHADIKPTSLSNVLKHSVPFKFRVFAVVMCFKPENTSIQKFIRVYCPKCYYISEDASPDIEPYTTIDGLPYFLCPECSKEEAHCDSFSMLKYTFLITFFLHDGSGPPSVEVFLWKENAVKFFKGIKPEEALSNSAVADSILHMLWSICPNCRPFSSTTLENSLSYPVLDCCIFSYQSEDTTCYQMFDTVLL